MKTINIILLFIGTALALYSAELSSTTFVLSSAIDSNKHIVQTINISIPLNAIIFKKQDTIFKSDILIEYYFLDKHNNPLLNSFIDTSFLIYNFEDTKSDSIININKSFTIDSNTSFIKIILKDKMSNNNIQFKSKILLPYNPKSSYIGALEQLYDNSWHFKNDTIAFIVNYNYKKESKEYLNIIIKNGKFAYNTKRQRKNNQSDTVFIIKNLLPNKYKLIVEHYKDNKKTGIIVNEFFIDFSFEFSNKYYFDLINALSYIAPQREINILKEAQPDKREQLWNDFWKRAEKNTQLSENISYYEFINRFQYVNKTYTVYNKKGYKTDMGRIYIIYGKPDEIEKYEFEIDTKPYIVWYYYSQNYKFKFVDKHGYGEYILTNYYEQTR